MIKVSKKIEYSLEYILYLAEKSGKYMSLVEVSKVLSLPYRFLGQIAAPLKKEGWLVSREGKGGGYKLSGKFRQKSLYDLLVVLGEDQHMVECLGMGKVCSKSALCKSKRIWSKIENALIEKLKEVKLKEL